MKTILAIAFLVSAYFGSGYIMREDIIKSSAGICERQIKGIDCDCLGEAVRQEYPLYSFWIRILIEKSKSKPEVNRRLSKSASQCVT